MLSLAACPSYKERHHQRGIDFLEVET